MPSKEATRELYRRILHADADAFYVAVVRLVDPMGAGSEPLLIVGGAADKRGVVTSASYETRRFGVRSGMPTAQALRLCPNAVCTPVPGKACSDKSREVRQALERLTPIVEPASIDEFYMDLTGTERLYRNAPLSEIATTIRRVVLEDTGIPVSIGGGTSRLVSKLASKQAKPHRGGSTGVMIVEPGEEANFLAGLQLADIPGIGPRFQERLAEHGLRSVRDALALSEDDLNRWLGVRGGGWLFRKIRGIDAVPVTSRISAKSMSREHTSASDLYDDREIDAELQRLAMRVAADLRSKRWKAHTISVKIRDTDFTTRQASHTVKAPVSSDKTIADVARKLLRKLREQRHDGVRLLGVAASKLQTSLIEDEQLWLLEQVGEERLDSADENRLLEAMDDINNKFGTQSIVRASTVGPTVKRRGLS